MQPTTTPPRPHPEEQQLALDSYDALTALLGQLDENEHPEVAIDQGSETIRLPRYAVNLLLDILRHAGKGRAVTIVPETAEMTTQAAANFLGCSRPHLVKLLEQGDIPFTKVGRHRRIQFSHLAAYKRRQKAEQRRLLGRIMAADEADNLYDS